MEKTKPKRLSISFESLIEPREANDKRSAKAAGNKPKKKHALWLEFAALATVPLVLVLGNSMLVPVLPQLADKLGISKFQSSLVITLFSLTAGLVIPISGYLSDRFTRKAVLIPSLIVYGAAGILAGFGAVWGSYTIVIVSRAIQGIGAAGTSSVAMALVGDKYKGGTESQALGLIEAANGTGKVVSPIFGSLLALIVWFAPFFAFPVFCLLSLLAVIWMIDEPADQSPPLKLKAYVSAIGGILKEKGRWLLTSFAAGSIALFLLFGVLFYLSNMLEEKPYELSGVIKGLVLAIPLLGMVVTSYTTGALIKKNGVLMRWLMNIGLLTMTVCLTLAIFFNSNLYVFIGLLTLSSIGSGLVLPCLNTLITGAVERAQRGMITSLYNSLRFFGVAAGPPVFGWIMDRSLTWMFASCAALSLVMLALVFFLIRPPKEAA